MARLVWFVLADGRSVVAGCDSETRETLTSALAHPDSTVTFTADDHIERISTSAIRDFVLFDAKSSLPPVSAIYRCVQF